MVFYSIFHFLFALPLTSTHICELDTENISEVLFLLLFLNLLTRTHSMDQHNVVNTSRAMFSKLCSVEHQNSLKISVDNSSLKKKKSTSVKLPFQSNSINSTQVSTQESDDILLTGVESVNRIFTKPKWKCYSPLLPFETIKGSMSSRTEDPI